MNFKMKVLSNITFIFIYFYPTFPLHTAIMVTELHLKQIIKLIRTVKLINNLKKQLCFIWSGIKPLIKTEYWYRLLMNTNSRFFNLLVEWFQQQEIIFVTPLINNFKTTRYHSMIFGPAMISDIWSYWTPKKVTCVIGFP